MRVDGVMDVSAVATRASPMMSGGFRIRRWHVAFSCASSGGSAIFGRGWRGEQADDVCPVEVPVGAVKISARRWMGVR